MCVKFGLKIRNRLGKMPACVSADGGLFEFTLYDVNWVVALNMV